MEYTEYTGKMKMSKDIIVVGAFPQMFEDCREAGWNIIGATDYEAAHMGDVKYLGTDEDFISHAIMDYPDVLYVATPDSPKIRRKIIEQFVTAGGRFATIVVPTAKVSCSAELGEGVVVQHNATVQAKCILGRAVRVNVNGSVMHHSRIGDFVTVAPGAMILGYVEIGEGAYIGANATILPHIKIGAGVVIGAGAVVTKDVPDGETWVGVPARRLAANC